MKIFCRNAASIDGLKNNGGTIATHYRKEPDAHPRLQLSKEIVLLHNNAVCTLLPTIHININIIKIVQYILYCLQHSAAVSSLKALAHYPSSVTQRDDEGASSLRHWLIPSLVTERRRMGIKIKALVHSSFSVRETTRGHQV